MSIKKTYFGDPLPPEPRDPEANLRVYASIFRDIFTLGDFSDNGRMNMAVSQLRSFADKGVAEPMRRRCAELIERRMDNLRARKTESFIDPPSGRTETIEKGDWQGSRFEFELFTKLLAEINAIGFEVLA